ncbi:hypothetical protein EH31_02850 [Erythrobacter longus]|uniref:Uncharacterized protein n=1 Tax=Erythrobacter longus TaxID=1044 RepID=A0A074MFT3_ERYLO|nr:hypothetical protein [Erythrobacter longus]KEO91625.1 hypothetical protein EH31_02850 [Erythrobacter longus]
MPWLQIPDLERILLARGAYIAGVGTIETGLTELSIRLSMHEEYLSLRNSFPSRRADRIKFLVKACEIEGPLDANSSRVLRFVALLEKYAPLRDILAHGAQSALSGSTSKETVVKFRDFFAVRGGAEMRHEPFSLAYLEDRASKVCLAARMWSRFYPKLDDQISSLKD